MRESQPVREPKQKRSIEKKQLLIDTAKMLYCKNGYHNTTTNEIAKQANVSIGTLYSYFADKEAILLEVLKQLNAHFFTAFDFIDAQDDIKRFKDELHKWLYGMIENLVSMQESQKELYREIETLRYGVPCVAAALDEQEERIRLGTFSVIKKYQEHVSCADIGATAVIIADFTGALVNLIVFESSGVSRQRLMDAGVEALYKILRDQR
ncbi:TetR/AcrR family transcriptional regulator [Christensenellaceae bacterium OttesenSCG-928-M15]|nr:TetR/AcrR family transcriptional regulator [Christensenellaceae bacterium OttesenSCG-928-M15]